MQDINTIKNINKNGLNSRLITPQTHTITIGRNIGDKPLSNHRWKGFKSCIESFIELHEGEIFVNSSGHGTWINEEGQEIKEENQTFVFSTCLFLDLVHLKRLARLFRQDAIALTTGVTQLIKGN